MYLFTKINFTSIYYCIVKSGVYFMLKGYESIWYVKYDRLCIKKTLGIVIFSYQAFYNRQNSHWSYMNRIGVSEIVPFISKTSQNYFKNANDKKKRFIRNKIYQKFRFLFIWISIKTYSTHWCMSLDIIFLSSVNLQNFYNLFP